MPPAFALGAPVLRSTGALERPAGDRLAKVFAEDQLSVEKCGPPRNAADDYLPAASLPRPDTRAPRVVDQGELQGRRRSLQRPLPPLGVGVLAGWQDAGRSSEPAACAPSIRPERSPSRWRERPSIKNSHPRSLACTTCDPRQATFAKNRTIYVAYVNTPEGAKAPLWAMSASAKVSADEKCDHRLENTQGRRR